jgi:dynein heavy chain, axonemal
LTPNYTIEDWHNDLKSLMTKTGIEERQTVFIFNYSQILKEEFLFDIDSLINNGEIHGIFNKEEHENIVSLAKSKITNDELKTQINSSFVLSEFFQKVKENLHILLEMSPTGSNLRERVRTHKSLINCSNVIWLEEWPNSGYKAVAEHHFKDFPMSGYKDAIIDIMITMHHDATLLAKIPNIFPDFLENFKQASTEIKSKLTEIQEKYERGLDKLK